MAAFQRPVSFLKEKIHLPSGFLKQWNHEYQEGKEVSPWPMES
jgi:hypothetical protein